MQRLTLSLAAAAAGLFIAPDLATALTAVTTDSLDLRAGPAFDFPVVDGIPANARVNVHGCVRAYRWCDVRWRDARGWVPGAQLAYLYDGRREAIVEYGLRLGVPLIGFSFDTYWDRYYRGRPWYSERDRWRTVWRDRDRYGGRAGVREGLRGGGEGTVERQTGRRQVERTERGRAYTSREAERRNGNLRTVRGEQNDREVRGYNSPGLRQGNREGQGNVRTGRGERSDRGEIRGYNPPGLRQGTGRGPSQDTANRGGGRREPSARASSGSAGGRGGANVGREGRR